MNASKVVFIILFVIFVLAVAAWQGSQYKLFSANSKQVTGVVTKKEQRIVRPDQPTHTENWLLYSYTLDGKDYNGVDKVEFDDLWATAKEGQPIEIYYSVKNPGVSHPAALVDRRIALTDGLTK